MEPSDLEMACPECKGTTKVTIRGIDVDKREVYCVHCNASGKVPSPIGQAILDLVTKCTLSNGTTLYKRIQPTLKDRII